MKYTAKFVSTESGATFFRECARPDASDIEPSSIEGSVLLSVIPAQPATQRKTGLSASEVGWWCNEIRTLIYAGMTVVEALDAMRAKEQRVHLKDTYEKIYKNLCNGLSFSASVQLEGSFPSLLVASIKSSENTGNLVEALDEYLHYHELMQVLNKRIINAAIYPAVVASVGLLIVFLIILFVLPSFSRMYASYSGQASSVTLFVLGASNIINDYFLYILLSLIASVFFIYRLATSGALSGFFLRLALGIQIIKQNVRNFYLAKFYHSLSLMFKGGYSLDASLVHTRSLRLGDDLDNAIEIAINDLIRGKSVSHAFSSAGLTDVVATRLLEVAERGGSFERVLNTLARRHGEMFSTFVDRLARIVEPVMLLLVSLMVGGVVVMMYMPIFDITSNVR